MSSFTIVATPIDAASAIAQVEAPHCGGLVIFDGRVRNHHGGRDVARLEYEAYRLLAESEGNAILAEARQRFDIHAACCMHRVGVLEIGEIAVIVAVSAAHRDPAFEACRYIIDEVKGRVPIWKKESYADGSSDWTGGGQRSIT
jgi:molybdopterin synthase catalytic subunit